MIGPMKHHLLEVLGDVIQVVGMSWAFFMFYKIIRFGIASFIEPSMPILWGETAFCALFAGLGVYHLIKDLRHFAKGGKIG